MGMRGPKPNRPVTHLSEETDKAIDMIAYATTKLTIAYEKYLISEEHLNRENERIVNAVSEKLRNNDTKIMVKPGRKSQLDTTMRHAFSAAYTKTGRPFKRLENHLTTSPTGDEISAPDGTIALKKSEPETFRNWTRDYNRNAETIAVISLLSERSLHWERILLDNWDDIMIN
jgi:hypothetical protein